jgi:hypothetical protein
MMVLRSAAVLTGLPALTGLAFALAGLALEDVVLAGLRAGAAFAAAFLTGFFRALILVCVGSV